MSLKKPPGDDGPPSPKRMKATPFQGAQQKVFVLEKPEKRMNPTDNTNYGVTNVLSSLTQYNDRHELFLTMKHMPVFENAKNKCVLVRGYTLREDKSIRISDSTIVMNTGSDANITVEKINKHVNPAVITIAEILTKDKGNRISLKGNVSKVTNVLETKTSKRRIVTITDHTGSIEVKMWGNEHLDKITTSGIDVQITSLNVDQYYGRVSLNSNQSTKVQILEEELQINGKVIAVDFESDQTSIMISDIIYQIPKELLRRIFPLLTFKDNVFVNATVKGSTIINIAETAADDI